MPPSTPSSNMRTAARPCGGFCRSAGVGQQPFANNALQTAFACGELNVGQRVLDRITSVSPEGYLEMMKEMADERARRRDAELNTVRNRGRDDDGNGDSNLDDGDGRTTETKPKPGETKSLVEGEPKPSRRRSSSPSPRPTSPFLKVSKSTRPFATRRSQSSTIASCLQKINCRA
jgi:hypothetical protein